MITCEFCGTQQEQHDHWRHLIMSRVAALEDVVTREPPAEQPSWQETGGDCGVPGRHACAAMRDRAKAKAAEHAPKFTQEDARALSEAFGVEPAEPSGTGQVPSAPAGFRVVGQSGPGVVQSKGLWIRRARDYRDGSTANGEPRQITLPGSLGRVWDAGEYDILEPIAEPPAPAVGTLSEDLGGEASMRSNLRANSVAIRELARELAESNRERLAHRSALKEIATCIDPCGDGTLRSSDVMAAIHVGSEAIEKVAALEASLAQAERERDELGRQVEQMAAHVAGTRYNGAVKEREEATATIERVAYNTPEAVARSESDVTVLIELRRAQKERDDAKARERERCLAWVRHFNPMSTAVDHAIKNGTPAPKCDPDPPRDFPHRDPPGKVAQVCPHGLDVRLANCHGCVAEGLVAPREVAPDRTRTGSVAPKDIACPTCAMGRGDCCVEDGVFWPEQVHATRYFEAKRRR